MEKETENKLKIKLKPLVQTFYAMKVCFYERFVIIPEITKLIYSEA